MPDRRIATALFGLGMFTTIVSAQDPTDPTDWKQQLELATAQFSSGDVKGATELARRALAAAEKQFEADDEALVKPLLFLSSLLIMQKEHAAAEIHAERAKRITERQLAAAEQRLATTLKYLGAIYIQQGKFDDAERVYERAIEISEQAVGRDHPETGKHVGNLGALLLQRPEVRAEDEKRAEALFERSLAIWNKQPAPNPVYTVGTMCNLAELRLRQQQPDAALKLYADAVAIQERSFEAADPRLHNTLRRYAEALRKAGHAAEAKAIEERLERK